MNASYELLNVRHHGKKIVAVLPVSCALRQDVGLALDEELQRLATQDCESVVLDLRQVEFVDGWFFPRILDLRKDLAESSRRLSLCVSGNLKEVVDVLGLNRIMDVVDDVIGDTDEERDVL